MNRIITKISTTMKIPKLDVIDVLMESLTKLKHKISEDLFDDLSDMYDIPFENMLKVGKFSDEDLYNLMNTNKINFNRVLNYLKRNNPEKLVVLLIKQVSSGKNKVTVQKTREIEMLIDALTDMSDVTFENILKVGNFSAEQLYKLMAKTSKTIKYRVLNYFKGIDDSEDKIRQLLFKAVKNDDARLTRLLIDTGVNIQIIENVGDEVVVEDYDDEKGNRCFILQWKGRM